MALWKVPDPTCLAQHIALPPPTPSHRSTLSKFTTQVGLVSQEAVWAPTKQQGLTAQKDKLLHEIPQSAQPWARQNLGHTKDQMPAFQNQHIMPWDVWTGIQSYFIYSESIWSAKCGVRQDRQKGPDFLTYK